MKKFNFNKVSIIVLSAVFTLGLLGIVSVFAAPPGLGTTPSLGAADDYGVLSSSYINTSTTTITGAVGFTTGPAVAPLGTHLYYGSGAPYSAAGTDQGSALSALNAQACDYTFPAGAVDLATDMDHVTATWGSGIGVYIPGIYCTTAGSAASIGAGGITLDGAGTYIFRINGALTTVNNSTVNLINGASSCDVFWTPTAATTLGTDTTFKGNIIDDAGITIGANTVLTGRALAFGGTVTTDTATINNSCAAVPATLNVTKVVVNNNSGNKVIADFPLFIDGVSVTSGVPKVLVAGTYTVTETTDADYTQSFSASCPGGIITLAAGETGLCTITNDDIRQSSSSGSGIVYGCKDPAATNYNYFSSSRPELCIYGVTPSILALVKVPTPLALPAGPGPVSYSYTLRNVGTVPVNTISVTDNFCSPVAYVSGDVNNDSLLDTNETWLYNCSRTLSVTNTNVATATGWANGISTTDIASATVVVGDSTVPPLIHVTKIPNPLSLLIGWGLVNYTETITNPGVVPLSNVTITDDKCSPVNYVSGDVNNDSLLDPNEAWIYTCGVMLSGTTTNTVRVSGQANGITATDFAIATVVAYVPGLPITGFPPQEIGIMIVFGLMAGIIMLISTSVISLKKRKH